MKKYLLISFFSIIFVMIGCKEDEKGPLMKDNTSPKQISNVEVENLAGGAKITYSLPADKDLLYVLATYSTKEGLVKQAKSSVFKSYVILEGFSEAKEYTVSLKTVNRSENYSPEVSVKINPLEAPLHEVLRTIKVEGTWGGAHVSMYNEQKLEYILYTLLKDSITGKWSEYDRLYTSSKNREFYTRGLAPVPTDFAFYLTDKWLNSSDTLFTNITPLYEVEFDKSLWKDLNLPDDSNQADYNYGTLNALWTPGPATIFFQDGGVPSMKMPNWVSIDFGKEYVFGRFKLNNYAGHPSWMYGSISPRKFEIWATNTPSTNWAGWTFMGSYESIKPSGLPVGELSEDDIAMSKEGHNFDLPLLDQGFRYFRFKATETWGNTHFFGALEFTMYGQPVE